MTILPQIRVCCHTLGPWGDFQKYKEIKETQKMGKCRLHRASGHRSYPELALLITFYEEDTTRAGI